ncbi:MAG: ATP-binding protein [Methanobacteriota archaeon]|nr:MAG: ATP-binding protein [Euryarchaeota archaeon]
MEKLRFYLQWWFEYPLPTFIERNLPQDIYTLRLIPALIGPRRSGKSTLFFQMIRELRNSYSSQNILYINFEDDRLLPLEGRELMGLLDVYRQFFPRDTSQPTFLFLDEVQNVPNWENSVRRIYETEPEVKLFLTGSNSRMLSSDLATALRGRTLSFKVFPLDFKEFLKFKNYPVAEINLKNLQFSPRKNDLLFLFEEYLNFGGFPEVVLTENVHVKELILKEYIRTVFFADIVQRYGIRQVKLLDAFIKMLTRQMSSLFSAGKMVRSLHSIGFKVAKSTLAEYLGYVESAFLGKSISIFSYSARDQLQYPRKFYLLDNGLYRATAFVKDRDRGRLLENLVFTHLFRKYDDLFYWKNSGGYEVDFVVPELMSSDTGFPLIQACYNFAEAQVVKREVRALVKAANEFNLNRALIVTRDVWDEIKQDDLTIRVIPFIQWVLQE